MNVLSVIQAQSTRVVKVRGPIHYLPSVMVEIVKKYQFIGLPKPEQLLPSETNTPMTFQTGKVSVRDREIIIDTLQMFPAGLVVTTRTNTTDSDLVLDELMEWARNQFDLTFEAVKPGTAHNSQLEVRLESPLAEMLSAFNEVGAAITKELDDFWQFRPTYELTMLGFYFDKTKAPTVQPLPFKLDRRDGASFEDGLYWAEASLSTDSHIAILGILERICQRFMR